MVTPGDTIWLRAGVYKGMFVSRLAGSSEAPIVVRAYRNERAILDQNGLDEQNRSTLTVFGRFSWFWGLEITNSEPSRIFPNSFDVCPNRQHCRPEAVSIFGPGTRVINCVIHDAGGGIGMWSAAQDSEAYGNIVFFIGWQGRNGGAGHSIYAQNRKGTARITDNILFSGFHSGIHVYGSSDASLRNFEIQGNTVFSAGLLGEDPSGWGILVGGNVRAENITIARNYIYHPEWYQRSNNLNPSYGIGTTGLVLEENYSIGYKALGSDVAPTDFRANLNVFSGFVDPPLLNAVKAQPGNQMKTLESFRGESNKIFLRRNRYEPDIANVTVFNWKGGSDAALDLSSFLKEGDNYEIVDVQNWFAGPIVVGSYDGKAVSVPMQSGSAKPIGIVRGTRYRTGSEFGVFQVRIQRAAPPAPKRVRSSLEWLKFSHQAGGRRLVSPRVLTLDRAPGDETLEWRMVSAPSWLRLSHENGAVPDRLGISAGHAGLDPGSHESQVVLDAGDGEELVTPVILTVLAGVATPVIDLVAHRARLDLALSPEAQFTVYGSNLASASDRTADRSPLALELGGTRVLVNGEPAGLVEVSENRIIAVPPASVANESGPVEITVRTAAGSTTTTVRYIPVAIGIIEMEELPGHVRAEHADGSAVAIGPAGARPAKPGDVISVYSTGLTGLGNRNSDFEVSIGGLSARAVVSDVFPGLAVLSIVVPDAPEGRQPLILKHRGVETQSAAYLPIAR